MKKRTNMGHCGIPASVLAAILFGWIFAASAQPASLDQPNRPDRPQRPGFGDPSLSEEQRTTIRETMEISRKEAGPLEEKMRTARRELQEAIHADKLDEQFIREKAAQLGKIEGDLAVVRAKAFAKIRPSLTPEQLARMKNMSLGFDRPRPQFSDGSPRGPRPRGEGFDGPQGRPFPPGEDRGPDGTLPPRPRPLPSE